MKFNRLLASGAATCGAMSLCSAQASTSHTIDRQTGMEARIVAFQVDRKGGEFNKPARGKIWLNVRVLLVNHSRHAQQTYGTADFQAVLPNGDQFDTAMTDLNLNTLHMQKLAPGARRMGWEGFEIPSNSHHVQITWSDGSKLDPAATIGRVNI